MNLKLFLKHCLWQFMIVNTCVTVAIAVLGMSLDPTAQFGYKSYFSPIVFSFLSLLPSLVTFSRREYSLRSVLIRKIIHLILLEAVLIGFGLAMNLISGLREMVIFSATVLAVDLIVNGIGYLLDYNRAEHINQSLKIYQGRS